MLELPDEASEHHLSLYRWCQAYAQHWEENIAIVVRKMTLRAVPSRR
jgi:hypothetical protein